MDVNLNEVCIFMLRYFFHMMNCCW